VLSDPYTYESPRVFASDSTGQRQVAINAKQTATQHNFYAGGRAADKIIITEVEFENGFVWRPEAGTGKGQD